MMGEDPAGSAGGASRIQQGAAWRGRAGGCRATQKGSRAFDGHARAQPRTEPRERRRRRFRRARSQSRAGQRERRFGARRPGMAKRGTAGANLRRFRQRWRRRRRRGGALRERSQGRGQRWRQRLGGVRRAQVPVRLSGWTEAALEKRRRPRPEQILHARVLLGFV